ncbi:ATP-dependent metalloprotease, partial [Enterobacter hormaechei]|nr:ATP-dependent metalloprotease [Enterobacter hormaechei]
LYAEEEGEVFLGRSVAKAKHMSDETARLIDQEVKAIIDHNYQRARQILMDNLDVLHSMKDALMKYETIDAPQIDDLMNRTNVRPPAGWESDNGSSNNSRPTGNTPPPQAAKPTDDINTLAQGGEQVGQSGNKDQ